MSIELVSTLSREEINGITPEYLHEHSKYDDGKLIRIKGATCAKIGYWEWAVNGSGRRDVGVRGAIYSVHRLIWIMHHGYIPVGMEIDHINRDHLDNRIENLRLVTHMENSMNRSDNTSGYPGVYWDKSSKKWVAQIRINSKAIYLGRFNTIEEAVQARRAAEEKYETRVREDFHKAV